MGYKIIYDHQSKRGFYKRWTNPKLISRIISVILTVLFLCMLIKPVREKVKQYILPGDAQVTEAALDTMIRQIRDGEPIYDAATAFCREIIDGAKQG